jgi:hypothetical protein
MPNITAHRVPMHTDPEINERIDRDTEGRIAYFERFPEEIPKRLNELDREWDIERVLETGSSTLTLTGLILGVTRSRKWLLLSLAVQGFFMQHALQGWCPPLPVFRRMGIRTADEINRERCALTDILNRSSGGDASTTRSSGEQALK